MNTSILSGMVDCLRRHGTPVSVVIEGVPTAIMACRKDHGGEALFIHYIRKPCPTHGWDWLLFDVRDITPIVVDEWINKFKATDGEYPREQRLEEIKRLLIERDHSQHDVFRIVFGHQW